MIQLFISLLTLGFVDCLNPATIATLIILLPIVKKLKDATLFIWGTFVTYVLIGILFYYGIDKYLKIFVSTLLTDYSYQVGFLGILVSIVLFVIGIKCGIKVIKVIKKEEDIKDIKFMDIKKVNPKAILVLAIVSTFSDAPTALPYILFITNLIKYKLSSVAILLLLVIYCAIYVLPMVILYISYKKYQDKFKDIEVKSKDLINRLSLYCIPVICIVGGVWIIIKSIKMII